ncbi:uncharacterized protein LOC111778773 [Cucurbita pepo subsp. pepo]|uniref:uncharacterized protein LOC111778773 n=1 Tax=Cucurbita pepo subsp. pepo TaxID=3664 RepID=UPI000C9D8D5C|nr:uncharacterized protein LOC111778773 [Cucurbita pepo subsp. pepo]
MAKKVWNLVRVAYFLLRKGISKSKLMLDLNLMTKRGKLAGKAISNLMFHHHYHAAAAASPSSSSPPTSTGQLPFPIGADEYEFSCSNSPAFPAFHVGKRRRNQNHNPFFACAHAPDTLDDDAAAVNAVNAVVEILNNHTGASSTPPIPASPALPGFGRTPRRVRQLRITDSPFPLQDANADPLVDKAADEFISRFYKELRLQKTADEN